MNEEKYPRPERAGQNNLILSLDCPDRANGIRQSLTVGAHACAAHGYYGPGFQPETEPLNFHFSY
jgi:hypothetical protein